MRLKSVLICAPSLYFIRFDSICGLLRHPMMAALYRLACVAEPKLMRGMGMGGILGA